MQIHNFTYNTVNYLLFPNDTLCKFLVSRKKPTDVRIQSKKSTFYYQNAISLIACLLTSLPRCSVPVVSMKIMRALTCDFLVGFIRLSSVCYVIFSASLTTCQVSKHSVSDQRGFVETIPRTGQNLTAIAQRCSPHLYQLN